jgi:hypothetical protein
MVALTPKDQEIADLRTENEHLASQLNGYRNVFKKFAVILGVKEEDPQAALRKLRLVMAGAVLPSAIPVDPEIESAKEQLPQYAAMHRQLDELMLMEFRRLNGHVNAPASVSHSDVIERDMFTYENNMKWLGRSLTESLKKFFVRGNTP